MKHRLVDTHCHLDIIQSQGQDIPISLENSIHSGVLKLLQIGIDRESSQKAKEIAHTDYSNLIKKQVPEIYYSIGCHPTETHEFPNAKEILKFAEENLKDPKFSAIGEVGVDLYHNPETKNYQLETLELFLDAASIWKLPVVIHSRDAKEETFQVLKNWKTKVFGVIHCFTYDYNYGKHFVDLGFYVSFSGVVTFKNALDIQEAASKLPLDALLIETDSPFLAPPPHRGKRNEPSYLPFILEKIFSLRKESNQEVEEILYQNSIKFLNRKAYYDA